MTSRIYIQANKVELDSWKDIERYHPPSSCPEDWRNSIPSMHWRKGHSAYELAHTWEDANPNLPPEIQALFGGSGKLLAAIPEYGTTLPGDGGDSKSDILAFVQVEHGVCAVTVEGKVDEPFGDSTVREWRKGASPGKIKRLRYLFKKLGLPNKQFSKIRYQLLHRTAAALIEMENFDVNYAVMIVHSFSKEHARYEDFKDFLNFLGINKVERGVLHKFEELDIPLYLGWATGEEK